MIVLSVSFPCFLMFQSAKIVNLYFIAQKMIIFALEKRNQYEKDPNMDAERHPLHLLLWSVAQFL